MPVHRSRHSLNNGHVDQTGPTDQEREAARQAAEEKARREAAASRSSGRSSSANAPENRESSSSSTGADMSKLFDTIREKGGIWAIIPILLAVVTLFRSIKLIFTLVLIFGVIAFFYYFLN